TVDLAAACAVLEAFDGHMNEDSRGAVLFREWLAQYDYRDTLHAGALFAKPFDAQQPLASPHALASAETARKNLATAIGILETAGLPLDSTLGSTQFARFAGRRTPVHGGNSYEGVTNLIIPGQPDHPLAPDASPLVKGSSLLTQDGYTVVHGSSFILGLTFDEEGPSAEVLLTYGQSGDPGSSYFDSQTGLFRQREWRKALFTTEAIAEDTRSRRVLEEER
ncbi:MAG: penicillin acylase family protein, partial [Chromatocurvus sp.]